MKNTAKNPQYKNDYQMNLEVAERIIKTIESGDVQAWRKTWITTAANFNNLYELVINDYLAVNIYSQKEYNPILDNVPAGFYVTFIDIKKHDLKLKKGSKGVPHYKPARYNKFFTKNQEDAFYKFIERENLTDKLEALILGTIYKIEAKFTYIDTNGKEQIFNATVYYNHTLEKFFFQEFRYILEYFFKAADCGITNEDIKKMWGVTEEENKTPVDRIATAEAVKNDYIVRANLKFNEVHQDQAYYMPLNHSVTMPKIQQFDGANNYYQTLFHEFAHSTGHASLLNRKGVAGKNHGFGSVEYSKEELIAELSSLYTLTSLNLINDEILSNSIAYLRGWGQQLKDGIKHNIIATIAQSRKATNLILNLNQD